MEHSTKGQKAKMPVATFLEEENASQQERQS